MSYHLHLPYYLCTRQHTTLKSDLIGDAEAKHPWRSHKRSVAAGMAALGRA